MNNLIMICAYCMTGLRRAGQSALAVAALAAPYVVPVATVAVGSVASVAFATEPTLTDYSGTLDATASSINFAGNSTSFVSVFAAKVMPWVIAVIGAVTLSGIIWRLAGKSRKLAG